MLTDHQATDAQNTYSLDLSVVIPVYKSNAILPVLVSRLEAVLLPSSHRYEILLIDDGSMDDTWNTIDQLTQTHNSLRGISFTRNYGHHNALLCGIRAARGAVIVTMDDDLQHSPEDIPKLLAEIAKGYDVVYGTPVAEQHGVWRNLASQVAKMALQVALGVHAARSVSAFRAMRTSLRECFVDYRAPSVSIDVLLSWGTTHISALPVHHAPRHSGTSHYSVGRLLAHDHPPVDIRKERPEKAGDPVLQVEGHNLELDHRVRGFLDDGLRVGRIAHRLGRFLGVRDD